MMLIKGKSTKAEEMCRVLIKTQMVLAINVSINFLQDEIRGISSGKGTHS